MTLTGSAPAAARQLSRRSIASIAGAGISGVSTLAITVIITTLTGQQTAGAVFTVTSFLLVLQAVSRLGSQASLVWSLTWIRTHGGSSRLSAVLASALGWSLVIGVTSALCVVALAPEIAGVLTNDDATEAVKTALYLGAPLIPIAAVYDGLTAATQGLGRLGPT